MVSTQGMFMVLFQDGIYIDTKGDNLSLQPNNSYIYL